MIDQAIVNDRQESVNKRQSNVNDRQGTVNDEQTIISEKTKIDLSLASVWPIITMIIVISASWFNLSSRVDLLTQKVELLVASQQELTGEFRQWKSQAENRLGTVESNQNTVMSYIEGHLQVKIR